jgi:hypothetical protein
LDPKRRCLLAVRLERVQFAWTSDPKLEMMAT